MKKIQLKEDPAFTETNKKLKALGMRPILEGPVYYPPPGSGFYSSSVPNAPNPSPKAVWLNELGGWLTPWVPPPAVKPEASKEKSWPESQSWEASAVEKYKKALLEAKELKEKMTAHKKALEIEDLYEMIAEIKDETGDIPDAIFLSKEDYFRAINNLDSSVFYSVYMLDGKSWDCFVWQGVHFCRS